MQRMADRRRFGKVREVIRPDRGNPVSGLSGGRARELRGQFCASLQAGVAAESFSARLRDEFLDRAIFCMIVSRPYPPDAA